MGSGGGLLQKVNRDTIRFAIKANYAVVDGEERAQALARVLLERGADPNLASLRYGTTPCGEAAGISKDFMKLIVQAGGRLASDPSPFFYACGGEIRMWRMNFGEGGWRVDNFRSIGSHARYYVPRPEVVEYLLDRGADPRAASHEQNGLLHCNFVKTLVS